MYIKKKFQVRRHSMPFAATINNIRVPLILLSWTKRRSGPSSSLYCNFTLFRSSDDWGGGGGDTLCPDSME